ncbi:MAG TPA: lipopolysaccharide kinase InaA family protein [Phycisphaerae bacterium]|nr:lipopolysaccharide kinase InaA family protein [Phycisphaerae bacterium]
MTFACDEAWREPLRQAGLDSVEGAFAFAAGADLDKPGLGNRRRTRLELADSQGRRRELILKRYGPEPLRARLRRAWTYGLCGAAEIEYRNIRLVAALGIDTMQAVAWGGESCRGGGRSFLLATVVPGEALERCGREFLAASPERAEELTAKLAALVARLHGAGYVHRDLGACHVFLHVGDVGLELNLIDLARVFAPSSWRMFRWRVKDLAQLLHSMPSEWVEAHWEAFLRQYLALTGGGSPRRYARAAACKAAWIARHEARRKRRREGRNANE